ncbi:MULTISPECIES: SGNH/GDSL hydrolase family protein [Klebsiella]|uniref:SGNH/GDSL hydrolase family protein n=1 Tax=Klebsiella quasipneumoniae subsp. quasipneumoniae TaxID=1667327 RepID=A0AAW8XJI2_9ENTR|nr:SGNH/GDSL hydrolase family protein [Klebsiella quasipneumoniae]ELT0941134.1 SGNH/GDSL hydrolase family protein [Klebsiella quasipneumoniae]MBM5556195.1 SGNH/GDSL hydrolase family protein [Klebsiella quasipneumoniae]MBM5563857.1 SGNH/GDSL hydrolase family protein [Klebsiella quasipneumoniae]MCJ4448704.1 SGNH/GDSL hydrolase family protein [Klebsiella quasipneumoniae]MDV0840834.1 SGNH/GDSL hydrolase family protein [Klebsiella quasipneumoniae subsp. quasipneumoniae]
MAEFIPPLGTADPQIFMDNVRRLDQLMQSTELTFPDRAGELLYTWRGIHQTLIPLSKQYMTLAAAQADIVNIPVNATTYVRSPDGSALADEYMNVAGTLTATGRRMPSQQSVDESHKNILGYLTDALPNLYRFKTVHCQTAPTAQAASVAASWFILPDALTAGLISKVELAVATAGKIYVATFSKAGNVFTRKKVKSFDIAAGTVSLTPEMLADDGDYIGVYTEGGLYFNTAATITGTVYRWASTTPGSDTNFDTALATGSYSYTFQVRATALRGNALSIATDALNTQLIGIASRFDNLSTVSRAGDGNRMFMLNTPVKFDGVVTGVTWLANNAGGGSQTVRAMAYRLSGSTYTLVDSQMVSVIPADNTVAVLPLYLSVKAGDFLVFSAPLCFDSLVNFGVNFADAGYSIYSPSDSTIPASIPASSFAAQTGSVLCVRFAVSYLAGNAEQDKSVKNAMISRLLRNADGLYLTAARPIIFDAEGVNGTANAIYVPRVMNYSSMAEQRSITLSNSLAVDNVRGPYTKITFSNMDFRDARTNYRLVYIDLASNTLKVVNGISAIPAVNILPVLEIYGRLDAMNYRVFGGLTSIQAQRPKNIDAVADLYDAITNPLRDSHIGHIGDSIDWGVGATGIASIDPRSHQLSDARNNFTSRTWVNLFRKWTAELSCHAKNTVDTQATGLSTYYNAVNVEVQDAWKDFTPADISSGLLTQTKAETIRTFGANHCIDILAGRSVSFQFSGPAISLVYATLQNLNASIYIDGVLNTSVVTDGTVTPTFGTRLDISGLTDAMHTMRIECAASAGSPLRLQYLVRNKRHSVMNSGLIGTNTAEWLPGGTLLVPEALPSNVTHVLIKLGTNDRGMATGPGYMAGAQGTFVNLNAIVNSLRSTYPGVRIILIAPPYAPTDSAYGSSDEIARAVRRAARVLECGFIDLYSPTLELEMQGETWLSDGLHPNDYGYRTMFKAVQAAIVSAGTR